ncbi:MULTISPECIES: hypothetical protein [unclassified Pseudomonas]|uniref:hypothetical protein n=1 Tax=unclassified Pseudomonas TaxID=196821 RepID=UPI000C869FCD|nr:MULTISPECIES: hypothetical protein [unclassified Pseudomonas]PMV91219.1 hypothetical protein C1X55_31430 [Pseudomonas sp. GW460-C8]PMW23312.1 hypothetical protein C1X53_12180 [Pseudomonas sp. GW456-E6]PMW24212.1 hypothetical protein C1X40_05205 [Pseudomonas sp. GW456-11-11-14-TSB2]PMW40106.1 hypothetical protein C1X45_08515 [Pseudomonas sp. GW460-7]PMW41217.1 hypothetical protein C1X48_07150 [Pseudomonas sp. FW305-3-2-15-A-R2A1]
MKLILAGQPLFTKDGRVMGNARVTGAFDLNGVSCYNIVTDFGNAAKLNAREIHNAFYLQRPHENDQLPMVEQLPHGMRHLHLTESHGMNVVGMAEMDGITIQHDGCQGMMILQIPAESWEGVSKALFIPDTV